LLTHTKYIKVEVHTSMLSSMVGLVARIADSPAAWHSAIKPHRYLGKEVSRHTCTLRDRIGVQWYYSKELQGLKFPEQCNPFPARKSAQTPAEAHLN
jgi:hypothetical protein